VSGTEAAAPVLYAWWVLAFGVALLLAAAAWLWWVLRRRGEGDAVGRVAGPVRRTYRVRVDEVYERFTRGEIDLRALHLELARLVREFGSERVGQDLTWMSRGEVAEYHPRTGLGPLLARYEQPSFSRDSRVEAETTMRMTREVIESW